MKWRDVLIGAFITLVVTVIGGILVYYVTKEPAREQSKEHLVFQSDTAAKFSSKTTKLLFHQIRIANIGDAPAHSVLIGIEYINKAKIVDTSVAFSSGPAAGEYSLKKKRPDALTVTVGTLAPSEVATVSLIVDAEGTEPPSVAVKSDKTIGSASPIIRPSNEKAKDTAAAKTTLSILMPLAIVGQVFLIRFFKNVIGGSRSINNVAFMYIHRGLCAEAKPLLQQDIF